MKTETRRRRALWSVRGMAAVLAVAAVSGVLVYRLWEPVNREVTTLDPVGSVRGPEERGTARLSSDIALGLRSGESYSEYRAEIRRDGQLVETLSDLRKDSPSEVLLKEPGSSLEPGDYEIVLLGLQNGLEEELARYEVRFVDP